MVWLMHPVNTNQTCSVVLDYLSEASTTQTFLCFWQEYTSYEVCWLTINTINSMLCWFWCNRIKQSSTIKPVSADNTPWGRHKAGMLLSVKLASVILILFLALSHKYQSLREVPSLKKVIYHFNAINANQFYRFSSGLFFF